MSDVPSEPGGSPRALSEAESCYLDLLVRTQSGAPADFEELLQERPELADALERVHARWTGASAVAPAISIGFSERLLERYGAEADPGVSLAVAGSPGDGAPTPESDVGSGDEVSGSETPSGETAGSDRYQLLGEVARGGMGAILEVWDRDLERPLAMKVIHCEGRSPDAVPLHLVRRFLREARISGQLDHPGVVPVHEVGVDAEGRIYFTMRLVAGRDLREIFEKARRREEGWNRSRALGVILKVCDTMAYCHEKGVVHRDLKPANVMVGGFGEVYVMDWGLAKVVGESEERDLADLEPLAEASATVTLTRAGAVIGTPAFMPPEQAQGRLDEVGPRSDVYAVGAMLYTLLSGEVPYGRSGDLPSADSILDAVREGPPAAIPAIDPQAPDPLVRVCERAMEREPEARFASMVELGESLRSYLEAEEQAVLDAERARAEAENAKQVAAFLTSIFEVSDPSASRGEEITAREILDRGAARLGSALDDQPLVQATLRHTMGVIYENLGLYDQSEGLLEAALAARRRELGDQSLEVAEARTALGSLRARQGRGADAEAQFRSALEIRRQILGPRHSLVATSLSDLSAALLLKGEVPEAEPLCREAVELRRELGEEETLAMGHALHNLAFVLAHRQDHAEAEPHYRAALRIWRGNGKEDLETLSLLNNLGDCLFLMGRYAESAQWHREALPLKERILGLDHPSVANTLNNLGSTLYAWGDLDGAEQLLERALDVRRRRLGPDHPMVATTLSNLGNVFIGQGRLDDAERLHRESVALRRERLGDDHPSVRHGLSGLAQALEAQGKWEEAATAHEEAIEVRRRSFGGSHPEIAVNQLGLARVRQARGDLDEAEALAREALKTIEEGWSPDHPKAADAVQVLAAILADRGQTERARSLAERALAWRREHLLPGHRLIAQSEELAQRLRPDST